MVFEARKNQWSTIWTWRTAILLRFKRDCCWMLGVKMQNAGTTYFTSFAKTALIAVITVRRIKKYETWFGACKGSPLTGNRVPFSQHSMMVAAMRGQKEAFSKASHIYITFPQVWVSSIINGVLGAFPLKSGRVISRGVACTDCSNHNERTRTAYIAALVLFVITKGGYWLTIFS